MKKILAIIPARGGSKRIPNKNIKLFNGKPLISYAIKQALGSELFDRVIVDTDSEKIAKIAKKYGAEVPFLRPKKLANSKSQIIDALLYLLDRLKKEQGYEPSHICILQATSPLREVRDIKNCLDLMSKSDATTVLTVCPTGVRLYHMDSRQNIILVNGKESQSTNVQDWLPAYVLNGCFVYVVSVKALRTERRVITKKTKAIVCEIWRSVDINTPEDWVLGELIHKNRDKIYGELKKF